jgi:hypothetical protein
MLKIVIDATPIAPKPSGVGFYVASLIDALAALQSQEDFQLGLPINRVSKIGCVADGSSLIA